MCFLVDIARVKRHSGPVSSIFNHSETRVVIYFRRRNHRTKRKQAAIGFASFVPESSGYRAIVWKTHCRRRILTVFDFNFCKRRLWFFFSFRKLRIVLTYRTVFNRLWSLSNDEFSKWSERLGGTSFLTLAHSPLQ